MRIKRFEAPDTTTALAMVKAEMGDDAVILATRTIGATTGNIVKKGRETRVEVVAAMDYDLDALSNEPALTSRPAPAGKSSSRPAEPPPAPAVPEPKARPKTKHHIAPTPAAKRYIPAEISIAAADAGSEELSHLEAHDLRVRFSSLLKQHHPDHMESERADSPPRPTAAANQPRPTPAAKPHPHEVTEWRDRLIDQLSVTPLPEKPTANGPAIIALVGATGVGKTTTAAKLAAWFSLRHGLSVAMLSMDCYRIGATDQLRTYARIMRLPCEIVLRRQDLAKALHRCADKDVIIVDTAGKSPYDQKHIDELREWFGQYPRISPYLVLSATTKKEDLASTVASYAPLAIAGLILTKIDETRTYATLCQQVVAAQLPVASLCIGQRVPEDFMVASKPFLAQLFRQGWEAVVEQRAATPSSDNWTDTPHRNSP